MDRFQDITASIIEELREKGVSQSELARRLDLDRSVINRWKGGTMEGFALSKGPQLAASLAGEHLAAVGTIETIDRFIESYCAWVAGTAFVATDWEDWAPLSNSRTDADPDPWLHLLIVLRLLTSAKKWDEAFRAGWRLWNEPAQQHIALNYRIRNLISEAKEHLSKGAREEVVGETGKRLGLNDRPGSLDEFATIRASRLMTPSVIDGGSWEPLSNDFDAGARFAHCKAIDALLVSGAANTIELVLATASYEIPQECHEFAWLALDNAFRGPSDLFEAATVRLNYADLRLLSVGKCHVQRTSYLRDVATSQSMPYRFRSEKSGRMLELGSTPDALQQLSSQIASGFLLLTRDQHLVVRYKSRKHRPHSEGWVPFGGTADFQDLGRAQSAETSLGEFLLRSAARKMREQCQVQATRQGFLLLGMTLDLMQGLKPDFFGLYFVDHTYDELVGRFQPVYGHVPASIQISLDSAEQFEDSVRLAESTWSSGPYLAENLALLRTAYPQVRQLTA